MNLPEIAVERELPIDLDAPCLHQADYVRYGEDVRRLKAMQKELTEQRMEQTRPLDESKKKIMAWFERPLGQIKLAIDRRIAQMGAYMALEAEKASKLQEEAARTGAVAIIATPKAQGVSTRDVWKWKVVNKDLIPREFMEPDEFKISAWVRNAKGSTEIPGIEVYKEQTTVIRSN